jgi:hypothetical protein
LKRLILHAGQHKTASTSAQTTLAANRQLLREAGFLYPGYPGPIPYQHSHKLVLWRPDVREELLTFWRREAQRFRNAPQHTFILSGETAGSFGREDFVAFREAFADFDTTLVVAVRHWAGYAPSRWQEHVRWGDGFTLPGMFDLLRANFDASIDGDFALTLKRAAGVFDNVAMPLYTVADALPTLLRAFSLPDALIGEVLSTTKRANPSQPFAVIEMQRLCNLILSDHRGWAIDRNFRFSVDPLSGGGAFAQHNMQEAFIASGLPAAVRLRELVESARMEAPKRRWAALFAEWSARMNASLGAVGLPPTPPDWGADELDGAVVYTELGLGDVPPDLARAYLDFVRDYRQGAGQ